MNIGGTLKEGLEKVSVEKERFLHSVPTLLREIHNARGEIFRFCNRESFLNIISRVRVWVCLLNTYLLLVVVDVVLFSKINTIHWYVNMYLLLVMSSSSSSWSPYQFFFSGSDGSIWAWTNSLTKVVCPGRKPNLTNCSPYYYQGHQIVQKTR